MLKRRSTVSTRFVITTAIVYSVIIILIVLSFLYILTINSGILKDILLKNNDAYLLKKSSLIVDRLKEKKINNIKELSKELKEYCLKDNEFLYILLFSNTSDENYFKIQKKIPIDESFKITAEYNKLIQEKKDVNYLKTGFSKPVIDQTIYSSNNQYYKTVYHPILIKNNYIIEFFISASDVIATLNDYSEKINIIKKYSVIIAASAVIIIIITTLLFNYSFSLLIKNLSGHLKKAAEGSLNLDMTNLKDDDLNELALSFNGIFSELKLKKDMPGELFKMGVNLLKQENYNDSIAIFKTLLIIKPDTFGACFNLGVVYAKNRQYNLSLEMFEKALNANPGHEVTLDYITRVKRLLEAQKKNAQAFAEIKR
jgi:tetratricopeptide (TPR) repeat protein